MPGEDREPLEVEKLHSALGNLVNALDDVAQRNPLMLGAECAAPGTATFFCLDLDISTY